ncbi:MAG: hypothetical protein E4H17_02180 [Gemmatimonadales bacterium]|nr:MAG: hypothetical protein E4H17_02180 [Gemmatimonadales bacterium]
MKRAALLFLLTLNVIAVPAFADSDLFLIGFQGYDYESPNLDSSPGNGHYLVVGEGYKAVGFVTSFGDYLAPHVDLAANAYTYHYYDLTVQTNTYYPEFDYLEVQFANAGRGRFYEDSYAAGPGAQYGVNPPNATAPSTFIDGTVILGGRIDNLSLAYDFGSGSGSFTGDMSFDEGALLTWIPVLQRNGWTLSGLAGGLNPSIPDGYSHQINVQCRIPGTVPVTHRTWGALKALYR